MRKPLTFSKICLSVVILLALHLPSAAQCDCPSDTEQPQFLGPEWITIESCDIAEIPQPEFSDNCDTDLQIATTSELISSEYYGLRSINSLACEYAEAWSLILFNVPQSMRYYRAVDLGYRKYADNTLHIYGKVESTVDSLAGFVLDVWLYDARSWTDWTNQGYSTSYKADCNGVGANHEDWMYYKVQAGSNAVGYGHLEGSIINFTHAPTSFFYGFQEGIGANNTSAGFGLGGWVIYTGTYVNSATGQNMAIGGSGDIAGESESCPSPQYSLTHLATDNCGNQTVVQQIIEVRDHTAPVLANGFDNPEVLCSELINWEPVWEDNCSQVTVQMDEQVYVAYDGCGNADYLDPNFIVLPTFDDCEVYGCTDQEAFNYDPNATVDDGSCYVQYLNAYVFHDLNMNGVRENNEPYIPGAHILHMYVNQLYTTGSDGMVTLPYAYAETMNVYQLDLASTAMSNASTPVEVSFFGLTPPSAIVFGVYDVQPSGPDLNTTAQIVGKLCGAGTFDILFGATNAGDGSSSASAVEIVFPAGVTVTGIELSNASLSSNTVSASVPALSPGQSISWMVTILIEDTNLLNTLGGMMPIQLEFNNSGDVVSFDVYQDCGESGPAGLASNPQGEGAMNYIASADPILYTFQYFNSGETAITSFDLGIYIGSIFDLASLEILLSNADYTYTVDLDNQLAVIHFENLSIAPQHYLMLQYALAAPDAEVGDQITHRVFYYDGTPDQWSNEVVLNLAECPANLDITTNATGCAGAVHLELSSDLFEAVSWSSNGMTLSDNAMLDVELMEMGTYMYLVEASNSWCSVQQEVEVEVLGIAPSVAISSESTLICGEGTLTLEATAQNASIAWYTNGVTVGEGSVLTIDDAGDYQAVATDNSGCGSAEDEISIEHQEIPEVGITASGELEFCEGGEVVLNFNSTTAEYEITENGLIATETSVIASTTATYNITAENECGMDSETIEVVVNESPEATASTTENVYIFTASEGASYQWYLNGEPIEGEIGMTITTPVNGVYQVEVTNAFGCSSLSAELIQNNISVNDISAIELRVYPNPSNDRVWLVASESDLGSTFAMFDALGQMVVAPSQINRLHTSIDVNALSPGYYIVRMSNGKQIGLVVE
jgi:hypothetical protein